MSPTAINLIAITIFVLTASSLLGPLFNLSPAVPAVATFVILGLATLDSLSSAGAGTILMDWLEGASPERRERVLRHEAGHFLVAHLLGISVTGYALNAWEAFRQGQSAQGGVRFEDEELAGQLQSGVLSSQMLERYCTVWMAGIAAENFVYGRAGGGTEDRQKLRAVMAQLRRPEQAALKERWACLQARTLIESHQPAYEALVAAMAQRLPVAECCQVIERHRLEPAGESV
jgi:hypothetical protein